MTGPAASAIIAASRGRRPLAVLGAAAPADVAAAYAVQREVAEALGALPPAGFKIGATAKQMQNYLGIATPAAGFIATAGLLPTPARCRLADYIAPGCEPEVALRLGRDIPFGRITRAEAAAAVAEIFAGIEIVENRYTDFRSIGAPTLIADQFFHAACVLGAPAAGWREADLGAIRGRITVNGALRGEGAGADLLGHPLEPLVWLAASPAAAAFGGLRAGQVVFCGSVTPPVWLEGPSEVVVEFDVLGTARATFA